MSATTPRAEATRARLFEAAIAAFAEKGFHGTTTRDIAAAAGMSPAALYVHHKSKEELLHLISRAGHEQTLAVVRDAIAGASDPVERLRAVVRAFAVHHARGNTQARIINDELSALGPEHAEEIRLLRRTISDELRHLVDTGVASGQFTVTNPRMTAVALLSLGIDIARWYREEGEWTPDEIGEHYADLATRLVGAR
ncbi:TetR family transcriptional regulator [Allosaccharopolyspora coralli]|uniref:TetR family transcriptional regulator n=1 Tax=Allosaccharopolyspora coralli TaxID=2665642 RepID=A0A5Q3Q3U2_9PSEU|nr:TetR family transcriptional regulator [Allosaccharopolyspora coralli]QGK69003.1 TetR family transcriptional regulator [Allosaccharopolyspora coralli]